MDIYEVKINCDSTTLLYAIIHQVILKKCQWDRIMMCRLIVWYSATNSIISSVQCECTTSDGSLSESLYLVSFPTDAPPKLRDRDRVCMCICECVCVCVCVCVKKRGQEERETERKLVPTLLLSLSSD